jgi:hypothetical protein
MPPEAWQAAGQRPSSVAMRSGRAKGETAPHSPKAVGWKLSRRRSCFPARRAELPPVALRVVAPTRGQARIGSTALLGRQRVRLPRLADETGCPANRAGSSVARRECAGCHGIRGNGPELPAQCLQRAHSPARNRGIVPSHSASVPGFALRAANENRTFRLPLSWRPHAALWEESLRTHCNRPMCRLCYLVKICKGIQRVSAIETHFVISANGTRDPDRPTIAYSAASLVLAPNTL